MSTVHVASLNTLLTCIGIEVMLCLLMCRHTISQTNSSFGTTLSKSRLDSVLVVI